MNARRKQELLKLEAEHLENARFLNRADVVVMTESLFPLNCDTYLSLVITAIALRYFAL